MGNHIFKNPELGFKEYKTSKIIQKYLKDLNIPIEENISITGLKATIGNGHGINIGIIAEMDAVPTGGHKYSSDDLGAAHTCAHSNQIAIMLAVMKALKESKILEEIGGTVTFIGAPAEEFTDIDYRESLIKEGKIKYCSGKQDMISKGVFDNIDLVISCHTMGGVEGRMTDINSSLNGFIQKTITYIGKAAHAGAAPHLGINALNAAVIGLTAVNAQRETFIDDHNIRVHGIIKNGGHTVNSIPEKVEIEAYVRGGDVQSIIDANHKVNRAFEAGAYAVGGKCLIKDRVGYMPLKQCEDLSKVIKNNMDKFIDEKNIIDGQKSMASGDIGDLASIIPTIQFGFSGFSGNVHGSDFSIVDEEMAYIIPAKIIAMSIYDLLKDHGKLSKEIKNNNIPRLSREEYLKSWLGC
ncbi:MAG: amidohydrolase [Anaeromicrobium sp.]|nr:amidohydrolase [Anaeromicrobium sp.]MCT4595262.1 amidohydrolase [Anaeromicrobium sp.]